jgi:hypothetical protein
MDTPQPPPPPGVPRRRSSPALPWIAGALAEGMVLIAMQALPAREGELAPVRWLRTAADHPWRTSLAFGLLLCALRPAGSGRSRGPADDRAG